MNARYTYEEIAESFSLWQEYVDPGALMDESEFESMPISERIQFQVNCFGPQDERGNVPA